MVCSSIVSKLNERGIKMKNYFARKTGDTWIVRNYKEHVTSDYLKEKHPDREYIKIKHVPGIKTLEDWSYNSGCEAIDGCWVEPDGICEHGKPSWLLALGMI